MIDTRHMPEKTPADCAAKVAAIIANINGQMHKPALRELSSMELKHRADRQRQTASTIITNGGEVRPEYVPIDLTETYE